MSKIDYIQDKKKDQTTLNNYIKLAKVQLCQT